MARIPETDLQRLKEEVSVQRLVEGSGVELRRAGKDWLGRCPFHEDETASLVVNVQVRRRAEGDEPQGGGAYFVDTLDLYLTLIRAIALLHQHQREVKTIEHAGRSLAYIEVVPADIEWANRLAHQVMGRTLDELPPQTRNLLVQLRDWVQGCCAAQGIAQAQWHFTRRQLREALRWGDTQLKVHLARLVELEHVVVHRRGLLHEYVLVYDARGDQGEGGPHCSGLLDVGGHAYDADRSGWQALRSAPGRPAVGGQSGIGRGGVNGTRTRINTGLPPDLMLSDELDDDEAHIQGLGTSSSAAVVAAGTAAEPAPVR